LEEVQMLNHKLGLSMGWAGALVGAVMVFSPACGGTGDTGGGSCIPNETKSCTCAGGAQGSQVCGADGKSLSACDCGGQGGSGGGTGSGGFGAGVNGACGDGICATAEMSGEFACPEDCPVTSSSSSSGTGGTGGTIDPCAGHINFAGYVDQVPSAWGQHPDANAKTGYDAGIAICKTLGADHPCAYEEVLVANAAHELDVVPTGVSAWIHRMKAADVGGTMVEPGPGGRCNDWVYTTNHISDGEYATFETVGNPSYHLDNDTFYDGVDTTHTQSGELQCGGQMRAILCCFPTCTP
jgi:hypothetical protein